MRRAGEYRAQKACRRPVDRDGAEGLPVCSLWAWGGRAYRGMGPVHT